MENCTLCRYVLSDETARLLCDGKLWKVVLSPDQQYLGKSLFTLKRHAASLRDLSDEESTELFILIKRFESSLIKSYRPTHFNWSCLMNKAADPRSNEPFHVHWHAIARYDQEREINGEKFIDQRWPNSARDMAKHLPRAETMKIIRDRIASNF